MTALPGFQSFQTLKQSAIDLNGLNVWNDLNQRLRSRHCALSASAVSVRVMNQITPRYVLGAASAIDFISASPFSNWPPIILSMFMNRWIALAIKLFSPVMLHVTAV